MINDRSFYLKFAEALSHPGDFLYNITNFFAKDADINVVHPFNQLTGVDAYLKKISLATPTLFQGTLSA